MSESDCVSPSENFLKDALPGGMRSIECRSSWCIYINKRAQTARTYKSFRRVAAEERLARLARDGVEVITDGAVAADTAHLLRTTHGAVQHRRRPAVNHAVT